MHTRPAAVNAAIGGYADRPGVPHFQNSRRHSHGAISPELCNLIVPLLMKGRREIRVATTMATHRDGLETVY